MWSGYGKAQSDGIYLELVKPSPSQQKHSTVDDDIDTDPYIVQLAIKTDMLTRLNNSKIILRDPYGVENEITIGEPQDSRGRSVTANIKSAYQPTAESSKIFHVNEQMSLYSTHAKIRTVYTAAESTEDNHAAGMSGSYDIEAVLNDLIDLLG